MKKLALCLTVFALAYGGSIVPELEEILSCAPPDTMIAVIAHTSLQADLGELPPDASYDDKMDYLRYIAGLAQQDILDWLATTEAENVQSFWLASRIALTATPAVIESLAERPDVEYVIDDFIITLDVEPPPGGGWLEEEPEPDEIQWNITKVGAPTCWNEGYNGSGVVVGNIDTGVFVGHEVFGGRWRSTNGWFDAVNSQSNPYDDNNHGTHCMGTAVGGLGYGVAPGATFIAAKGFNAAGAGNASWIEACINWMAGTGRPDVLSNSWSSSRENTFYFAPFQNLRNLGTVVVASIGNAGPQGSTSRPPGSYPISIGVGATDNDDVIANFSSRGPAPNQSPWNQTQYWPRPDWNLINPGVSAPGVSIRSALSTGGYGEKDGTSMACPHVAGAAAIMLQMNSSLTHDKIFNLFADQADRPSHGAPYPNNTYGWGRLNASRALRAVLYARPDNHVKNWWWDEYFGDNIYNTCGTGQNVWCYSDRNPSQSAVFHVKVENDGVEPDWFVLKATETYAPGTWTIRYYDALQGGNDITSAILSTAGWMTPAVISGANRKVRVEVTPVSVPPPHETRKRVSILTTSVHNPSRQDLVYMEVEPKVSQPDNLIKNSFEAQYIGGDIYNTDGRNQTKYQKVESGQTAVYHIKLENDSEMADFFHIQGTGGDNEWQVRYYSALSGGTNITSQVVQGTYWRYIPHGGAIEFRLEVKLMTGTPSHPKEVLVTSIGGHNHYKRDAVKAVTAKQDFKQVLPPVAFDSITGPNTGRMLAVEPGTGNVHLVCGDGENVHCIRSTDGGETWEETLVLDEGRSPALALDGSGLPAVSYLRNDTVFVRRRQPDLSWLPSVVFAGNGADVPGSPAIAMATDQDATGHPVCAFPLYNQIQNRSRVWLARLEGAGTSLMMVAETTGAMADSMVSIATTVSGPTHLSWQRGQEVRYWTAPATVVPPGGGAIGPGGGNLNPGGALKVADGSQPFVETHGDLVYLVWLDDQSAAVTAALRHVWAPEDAWTFFADSISIGPAAHPVCAQGVFGWQEPDATGAGEIRADAEGNLLNLSNSPDVHSAWPHLDVLYSYDPADPWSLPFLDTVYAFWTEAVGDSLYEPRFGKQSPAGTILAGEREPAASHTVICGQEQPSFYARHRTGYRSSRGIGFDYGADSLSYELRYLNPGYGYLAELVFTHDRGRELKLTLESRDREFARLSLKTEGPETLRVVVPDWARQGTRLGFGVKEQNGEQAVLAGLKLYPFARSRPPKGGALAQPGPERLQPRLYGCMPNPLSRNTVIRYQLTRPGRAGLRVYDAAGRLVKTLVDGEHQPGVHRATWNGTDNHGRRVAHGVYFYRLDGPDISDTKQMVLLR